MSNTTFKLYAQKLGARQATDYVGDVGDLFYDPTSRTLRISDGATPGGFPITAGAGGLGATTINYVATAPLTGTTVQSALDELALNALFKSGGTMTGGLILAADPTANLEAATKQYVDNTVANIIDSAPGALDTLNELAAALGDDPNFATTITNQLAGKADANNTYTISEVDALVANVVSNSQTIIYDNSVSNTTLVANNIQDAITELDTKVEGKLDIAGGTMTGDLILAGDPTANLQATTKQYVDSLVANAVVNVESNTVVFDNSNTTIIANTVQAALEELALNKVEKSGDTMTGSLILHADPTLALQAATKQYVDSRILAAADQPQNSNTVIFNNTTTTLTSNTVQAAIEELALNKVDKAGDTMTGFLTLSADPTDPLHAVTKQYLDTSITAAVTGGGVTASNVSFAPTANISSTDVQAALVEIESELWAAINTSLSTIRMTDLFDADTTATTPVPNDALIWNGANWVPGRQAINDLSNVTAVPTNAGEVLTWNGTLWVANSLPADDKILGGSFNPATGDVQLSVSDGATITYNLDGRYAQVISDLGDVDSTGVTNGQVLSWDGTNFVPFSLPPGTTDTFTSSGVIDPTTGVITFTKNDSGTYAVDIAPYVSGLTTTLAISDLTDADSSGVTNGQVLTWDATASNWVPGTPSYLPDATVYTHQLTWDTTNGWVPIIPNASLIWRFADDTAAAARITSLNYGGGVQPGSIYYNTTDNSLRTFDGTFWSEVGGVDVINDLSNVSANPTNAGEVLTWNGTRWDSQALPIDARLIGAAFNPLDGNFGLTLNDGAQITVNLDGRYAQVIGDLGDVDSTGVTNGQVLSWNGTNFVPFSLPPGTTDTFTSSAAIDSATGVITFTKNDSGTYAVDIDPYVANLVAVATANIALSDLTNVSATPTGTGEVLTWNGVNWVSQALPADTRLLASSFNPTTGDIDFSMSNGTTLITNLDGRYIESVNGVFPDANGNVAVALSATETGTLSARPATANDGLLYIVSGDSNTSLNGDAYIWVGNNTVGTWQEVAPSDQASNDARYVLLGGDTMTGSLVLSADPTAPLEAATKQYVDSVFANDVYLSTQTFNASSGQLSNILSNNMVVTSNLDGRYLPFSGGTMTGAITLSADPTTNLQAATKQYVDSAIIAAGGDTYVDTGTANSTALTLVRNDGNTVVVDMTALQDIHVANGVLASNNIVLTMNDSSTTNIDISDIFAKINQSKVVAGSFNTTTGQLSATYGTGGSFVLADLDGRYVQTVNGIAPDSNGNVAVALTETSVGTLAARPATANAGVVYVVANDPDANNDGKTFIYDDDTSAWYEVATADMAANDARYVNVSGDTMTGQLILAADPTANLEATTKQYVDDNLFNVTLSATSPTSNNNAGDLYFNTTVGAEELFIWDGTQWLTTAGAAVAGDVVGPASATDNAIARYDTTTGKLIQNSLATISDVGYLEAPGLTANEFIYNEGYYMQKVHAGYNSIDIRNGSYQTVTINSALPIYINGTMPPSGVVFSLTLEITMGSSGSITSFPPSVKWAGGTFPTFTGGKTHLVMLSTSNGGTTWLASAVTDFA